MSKDSNLLVGITIIHLFLQFLTLSAEKGTRLQQTPAIVIPNWIWYVGIFFFLKRYKFGLVQKMKNNFVRALVQALFVLTAYEFFVYIWTFVERTVLIWMPEAVDYVVGKLLGNGGITIPEWPFICLLWAIPLYCSHLANNTDILLAYYLNGNVDTASLDVMSDSSIQDGNVRKTTSFNNRSQRSNLTYTLRPRPLRSAIAL